MCGLTGLYHPEFSAMYKQIGKIGEIVKVEERLHEAHPNLIRVLDQARGVLTINGIHTMHRFFKISDMKGLGELKPQRVLLDKKYFKLIGEDYAEGELRAGTVPFHFSMSFRNGNECDNGLPIDYNLRITGTKGFVEVEGYESCHTVVDGKRFTNYQHPDGALLGQSQYPRIRIGLEKELREFLIFLKRRELEHHSMLESMSGQRVIESCYNFR
jgi:predicted dehydrogenase